MLKIVQIIKKFNINISQLISYKTCEEIDEFLIRHMQQHVEQNMDMIEYIEQSRHDHIHEFKNELKCNLLLFKIPYLQTKKKYYTAKSLKKSKTNKQNTVKLQPDENITAGANKLLRSGSTLYKFINDTFNVSVNFV